MLGGLNLGRDASRPYPAPVAAWDEREQLYAQVAGFLSPLLDSNDIVAASETGALGYACGCRILDTVGLVSPVSLRYYPISSDLPAYNAIPSGLVRGLAPDYLVSLEVFVRPTLLQDSWFRATYQEILRRETRAFGSDGLRVYRRLPRERGGARSEP